MSKELNKIIVAFVESREFKAWPKDSYNPDYIHIYDIPHEWLSILNDAAGIDNWDDRLLYYEITDGGDCEYVHLLDKNFTSKYTWCTA